MATRRSVTTISEVPYQEGDVIVKSTNGLPTYGMTEADMQNMQLAAQQQAAAQAQRTADIVNAARSGSITYGGNQGGTVTYGGNQGSVTILPDIRRDGDGVWLANMAPGRPIDLGPTAGWSGFNGQGQFVGYPSGMPHVLYGGFMDTLAPFMQYLSPMFRQAQTIAAQTPVAPATPATPSRRRTDTTGTTTEDITVGTGPVSRDITDNAWSIRTPATTWLEEAKRNIAGVDPETGQPILDLESIKPTEDLIMTGPRGNVIRFTPETTQERQLQQYSVPQFDTSVDIPTMEIPDYVEPEVGDIDWSMAIGTGGLAGFPGEIPDVSPEVAQNAMNQLSLFGMLLPGLGWGNIARAAGAAGASTLARRLGLGGGKPNVRVKPQASAAEPYRAPEQLRAPTVVRAEGGGFLGQPATPYTPYVAPQAAQRASSLSDWMSPFATQRSMWGMYNNPMAGAPAVSPQVLARSRALSAAGGRNIMGPPAPTLPNLGVNLVGPTQRGGALSQPIIRSAEPLGGNLFMGPPTPPWFYNTRGLGPQLPGPMGPPQPASIARQVRPRIIERSMTPPPFVGPPNPPLPQHMNQPIVRTVPRTQAAQAKPTTPAKTTKKSSTKSSSKPKTPRKKKAD